MLDPILLDYIENFDFMSSKDKIWTRFIFVNMFLWFCFQFLNFVLRYVCNLKGVEMITNTLFHT